MTTDPKPPAPIYAIAGASPSPEFPCWLWLPINQVWCHCTALHQRASHWSPEAPTPPAESPAPVANQRDANAQADAILGILAYDAKLAKLSAKELILEVLGSTAADYRCVTELMNRVFPGWNKSITDEETEAAYDDSPEKYKPYSPAPATGKRTDSDDDDEWRQYVGRVVDMKAGLDDMAQRHFYDMEGADAEDFRRSEHGYVSFSKARDELHKHIQFINRRLRKPQ